MKKFFLLIFFSLYSLMALGQQEIMQTQAKIYSVFLYNFTKYTKWPPAFEKNKFTIGFYGNDEYLPALKQMAKERKTVNNQKITILNFDSISDIEPCHMLFLPDIDNKKVKNINEKLRNTPTLIITSHLDILKAESCINFVSSPDRMKFEINEKAIERRNLRIAQNLKNLAILK